MRGKTAPKQGEMTPDAWNFSRNAKLGTWNGLQLYKACIIWSWHVKTDSRKPQNKHVYSSKRGQTANTNMAKLACKNSPKCEIKKQLTAAVPKQIRALQKCWRGAQNMIFYSLWQTTKTNTCMAKLSCKKRAKRWTKKQVVVAGLKHKGALQQCWRGAKNNALYSWWLDPKQ